MSWFLFYKESWGKTGSYTLRRSYSEVVTLFIHLYTESFLFSWAALWLLLLISWQLSGFYYLLLITPAFLLQVSGRQKILAKQKSRHKDNNIRNTQTHDKHITKEADTPHIITSFSSATLQHKGNDDQVKPDLTVCCQNTCHYQETYWTSVLMSIIANSKPCLNTTCFSTIARDMTPSQTSKIFFKFQNFPNFQ